MGSLWSRRWAIAFWTLEIVLVVLVPTLVLERPLRDDGSSCASSALRIVLGADADPACHLEARSSIAAAVSLAICAVALAAIRRARRRQAPPTRFSIDPSAALSAEELAALAPTHPYAAVSQGAAIASVVLGWALVVTRVGIAVAVDLALLGGVLAAHGLPRRTAAIQRWVARRAAEDVPAWLVVVSAARGGATTIGPELHTRVHAIAARFRASLRTSVWATSATVAGLVASLLIDHLDARRIVGTAAMVWPALWLVAVLVRSERRVRRAGLG